MDLQLSNWAKNSITNTDFFIKRPSHISLKQVIFVYRGKTTPMKYALLPFIALGLVLSLTLGIEYHCEGEEMFPTYYGSPFVFKQKSLGSSMEYFYSVSGLILNVLLWSLMLLLINRPIQTFVHQTSKHWIKLSYKICLTILLVFSSLTLGFQSMMLGRGFEKNRNYWYFNLEEEAKAWGMKCQPELIYFQP